MKIFWTGIAAAALMTAPAPAQDDLNPIMPEKEPVKAGLAGETPPNVARFFLARGAISAGISPDGKHIAFVQAVTGIRQLWVTSVGGGQPKQITFGNGVRFFEWAPDSASLIYGSDNNGDERENYYLISADGTRETLVLPATGLDPRVHEGLRCRRIRCGLEEGDVHAVDLELGPEGSRCRVSDHGVEVGEMQVPLPGAHMVHNALMAVAAAGCVSEAVRPGHLDGCSRVRRRFTLHARPRDIRVVEDYAHHPTELRATIAAARLAGGRVHVLFQPHRYTRSADCFQEFAAALAAADAVAVLPVYAAGEEPIPGVGGRDLAEAAAALRSDHELVQYVRRVDHAAAFLAAHARPGDTCLVLGAGDVGARVPELVTALEGAG